MATNIPNTTIIGLSFEYLQSEFLDTVLKESSKVTYANQLKSFGNHLAEIDPTTYNNLGTIGNLKSLNKVVNKLQLDYKQSTCKNIVATFKQLVAYAVDNEGLDPSILSTISKLKVSKKKDPKPQILPTKEELLKLRTHMEINSKTLFDLKCRTAIEIIYSSGSRTTETLKAQWKDFDPTNKVLNVKAETTKTNKDYFLILSDKAIKLLETLKQYQTNEYIFTNKEGLPMDRSTLSTYIQKHCKQAGLRPINLHLIRKYVASTMLQNGADLSTVSNYILHHESITTTAKYILPNQKKAMETISNLHKSF